MKFRENEIKPDNFRDDKFYNILHFKSNRTQRKKSTQAKGVPLYTIFHTYTCTKNQPTRQRHAVVQKELIKNVVVIQPA